MDEHGNRPIKEELIIILAGPFQHGIIALSIAALGAFSAISADYAQLLYKFNLMVLLFNLLPIWPLDGGKLVRLYLASRRPFLSACKLSLVSSCFLLITLQLFVLFFFQFHLNLLIVFCYLIFSLWTEWKQQRYVFIRFLLERHYGKQAEFQQLQSIEASGDDFLHTAMESFHRGCKHLIHVAGETSVLGKLDENEVLYAYFTEKQVHARLKDIVFND